MDYFAASVNESPVIALTAAAALDSVGGCAVAFDADGKAVLATGARGTYIVGIALPSNDTHIPAGGSVDVQYKDIGLVKAGAAFRAGSRLAPDANGALARAASGTAYIAVALQEASAPGELVQAIVERGYNA